jgi:hypothetical protein
MFFPNYNQHVDEFHIIYAADETLNKSIYQIIQGSSEFKYPYICYSNFLTLKFPECNCIYDINKYTKMKYPI